MKPWMIVFLAVAACGQMQTEPTSEDEDAIITSSEVRFTPATAEMVAASLTGDPDRMAAVISAAPTCVGPVTCPAQFGSCASWSSFGNCGGTVCTGSCVIGDCATNPNCVITTRFGQTQESFRVCQDAQHNACTEWRTRITGVHGCGCSVVD